MKRVSEKTAERNLYYRTLRRMTIPGARCQFAGCRRTGTDVHHRRGRGLTFMLNVATWSFLCRPHHGHIDGNPSHGRQLGLIESRYLKEIPLMPATPARCKSCGRPIVWATTEEGRSIPLIATPLGEPLAHPDEGGAGRLQTVDPDDIPGDLFGAKPDGIVVEVLGKDQEADPGRPVLLTHFVDCLQAEEWRHANGLADG